jgi:hypothetical protein
MHQVGGAVLGEDLGTRSGGGGEYTYTARTHTNFVQKTYIKLAAGVSDVFDVLHNARGE